jgi:hypothetical protein
MYLNYNCLKQDQRKNGITFTCITINKYILNNKTPCFVRTVGPASNRTWDIDFSVPDIRIRGGLRQQVDLREAVDAAQGLGTGPFFFGENNGVMWITQWESMGI